MSRKVKLTVYLATVLALSMVPAMADNNMPSLLGLPPTRQSEADAQSALGQKLFFDKRLSRDGTISCASCHQPERAFADGKKLAEGVQGQLGTRNTPSLINVVFNQNQFWDGRRSTLESQALDPLFNSREHGLPDGKTLLSLLHDDSNYRLLVRKAFDIEPAALELHHVASALASFERTLVAGDSPFDRYYFKGDKTSLTPAAQRGLQLFMVSAQCANCHKIGKTDALFTDNQFHGLGVGWKKIEARLPELTKRLVQVQEQKAILDQTILSDEDIAELGRFAVTLNPTDIGKFKTPSLRNVALTAPYMHDGSVATLEQAVELEIYYRSAESQQPLILTPLEKNDLIEFLKALTSSALPKNTMTSVNHQ